jgi:hypothetical protein
VKGGTAVVVASTMIPSSPGWAALDIDAFMNTELQESNTKGKPTLTHDQSLCQYGAPSRETAEACVRANMSTKRTNSLDAFGTVDRGDYVRCRTYYDDKGDRYEREWCVNKSCLNSYVELRYVSKRKKRKIKWVLQLLRIS